MGDLRRYWFNVGMLAKVLLAFILISALAGWGNELLDLVIEPPCSDGPALDGECALNSR